MTKELIISANVHEKKVAIIEDGLVTEFYVERRDENQGVVGNLYKGRVMKVLPGMQSAFVDIGLDRDAFLYVSDFTEFMEEEDEIDFKEMVDDLRPVAAAPPRFEDRARRGDRPRPEERPIAPLQPGPERMIDEEIDGGPAMLEDMVEQLAEIADESVIPPPSRDEDLEAEAFEDVASAQEQQADEAEVIPIEELISEAPAAASAEAAKAAPAQPERLYEAITDDAPDEGIAAQPVAAQEEKPKRGRSRKAAVKKEPEAKKDTRKAAKKSEAPKAKEKPEPKTRKSAAKTTARRSTRKRGGNNAPEAEAAPAEVTHAPQPWFERVTDEDLAQDTGEMLKDAMVQEKIIEQVHQSEYRTTPFQAEPEPEWRLGSLRSQLSGESGFERVEDDVVALPGSQPQKGEADADDLDLQRGNPFRHIADAIPGDLRDRAESLGELGDVGGIAQSGDDSMPQAGDGGEGGLDSDVPDEGDEAGSEAIEEGTKAEVRHRKGRAEFALRRGSRGRRRRPRDPQSGGPAAAVEEEKGNTAVAVDDAEIDAPVVEQARPKPVEQARPKAESQIRAKPEEQPRSKADNPTRPKPDDQPRPRSDRRPEPRFDRKPDAGGRRMEQAQGRRPDRGGPPTISELLHEGQEILVQIAKEPIAKKGARITSHMALPGRYLVYMPTVNHVGVSRKIPNEAERLRLKRLVAMLREREGGSGGFIARTACAGHTEQELQDDMRYLLRTWADIRKKADRVKAPILVHRDLDLVQRILRDQLSEEFTAIRVDNEVEYARMVEFINRVQPKLVKRVKLYTGDQPILEKYGVQAEIDKAVRPRVWLRSGGYIVINQTEALVAIDVNTGKFVGKSDKLEDTITRTNLEAAKEIVRQIRLRDLGGIIVIDFIDMEERKNRQRVMTALQQELQTDRAPSKILSINDFGLMAITRKRVKQSLERTLCTPCPYCQGAGMVKSPQTMCFEILEQAKAMSKHVNSSNDVMLRVSPDVAEALHTTESEVFEEIEAYFGTPLTIEADPNLHQEQFDFAIV